VTTLLIALYWLAIAGLCAQGLNCYVLTRARRRGRPAALRRQEHMRAAYEARCASGHGELPTITVQLPIFNERYVVDRLLAAVAALDYPQEKLEIQVLDDSTDDTSLRIERILPGLRARGLDVVHLRRKDRQGFKAGALAAGLECSRGELVAILDADFVPGRDFLRRCLPYFDDPDMGFVQCRWEHLNTETNLLTRAQALAIDGHFGIEQAGRSWGGYLLNFNGTAGIWRRSAIAAAGGWSGDTLTEDLDLSYRAQLAGCHVEYLPDVAVPAELPADLAAFKSQQRRWAKGSIQTARKLLPRILVSRLPWRVKLQATLHLTHYLVHPCMLAVVLLSVPAVSASRASLAGPLDLLAGAALMFGMCGPTALYTASQLALGRPLRRLLALPVLMLLGTGLAVSNTRAVLEALFGLRSDFVRTPKRRLEGRRGPRLGGYRLPFDTTWLLEGLLCAWAIRGILVHLETERVLVGPFLLLNAAGLLFVASRSVWEALASRWLRARPQHAAGSIPAPEGLPAPPGIPG